MTKVVDKGFDKIVEEMRKLDGVEVGFLDDAAPYPDGTPVQDVAAFNEFGHGSTPARPFMRTSFDQHKREIEAESARAVGGIVDGKLTAKQAEDRIGAAQQKRVQSTIDKWSRPADKDGSDPLRDTDHMRNSVKYRRFKNHRR